MERGVCMCEGGGAAGWLGKLIFFAIHDVISFLKLDKRAVMFTNYWSVNVQSCFSKLIYP